MTLERVWAMCKGKFPFKAKSRLGTIFTFHERIWGTRTLRCTTERDFFASGSFTMDVDMWSPVDPSTLTDEQVDERIKELRHLIQYELEQMKKIEQLIRECGERKVA